jgi:DNA repair exonuclease SbcCD ATPase subunit
VKISAKNFLSWAELDFEPSNGVTLIRGFNFDDGTEEGAGKSAVLNALSWGLFGEIPKDVNIDDVLKEDTKTTEVKIDLADFSVFRSRSPNDVRIEFPNGKVYRGKDARETQKEIVRLVGMSFTTFCQCVYFAQNYTKKFVLADQEGKGKILSEILDLEQFDRARKVAADRIKTAKEDLAKANSDLALADQEVKSLVENVATFDQLILEFNADKVVKIKNLLEKHADLEASSIKVVRDFERNQNSQLKMIQDMINSYASFCKDHTLKKTELLKQQKELEKLNLCALREDLEQALEASRDALMALQVRQKTADSERASEKKMRADLEKTIVAFEKLSFSSDSKAEALATERTLFTEKKAELVKALKTRDNPAKEDCPTCGQAWDGDPKHYEKEVKKTSEAVDQVQTRMNLLQAEIEEKQKLKGQLEQEIFQLDQELEAVKVPDIKELEAEVKSLEATIAVQKEELPKIRLKEQELISVISKTKHLEEKFQDLTKANLQLQLEEKTVKASTPDYLLENIAQSMRAVEAEINTEDSKEPDSLNLKRRTAQGKLQGAGIKLHDADVRVKDTQLKIARLEAIREGYREVKAYTFENSLRLLTNKANLYLAQLFSQQVRIRFKNEDLKIETLVKIDGQERALGLYSGGQFQRLSIAVDLALSDLTLSRKGNKINLLIQDEAYKGLSVTSMGRVLNILQSRKVPTLLIEHNDVFRSIVSQTVDIELRNGTSSFKI